MANSRPTKGTELGGKRTFVPGAEYGPGLPNLGRGGGTGTDVVPVPDVDEVTIMLRPAVGDALTHDAGATATLVHLDSLNPAFHGLAWSFPAAADDDNREEFLNLAIPSNLSLTPGMRARVHLIVP